MQTIDFLLEAKAMQFAERTLAHHLLDALGGPSARYYICLATLKLQRQLMEEAEEALKEALQFEHQVQARRLLCTLLCCLYTVLEF